jgi:acyl carrier protein
VVARLDARALEAAPGGVPPLLAEGVRAPARHPPAARRASAPTPEQRWGSLSAGARAQAALELVKEEVARALGSKPSTLDPERPLSELGLDSMLAVELRDRLSASTGLRLPSTLLFDHPSVSALATLLAGALAPSSAAGPALAGLDELEAAVVAMTPEERARSGVLERVQALLARCGAARAEAAQAAAASKGQLLSANDEELFALLDAKLGRRDRHEQ